jgi:6-phosphogluconolactonase (cycloisomerase 2 family)
MKQPKNSLLLCMIMLSSSLSHAAQPKFSVTPTAGSVTSILLPNNFSETVSYRITNNTSITRTLTMVPITGVSQTLGGPLACGNPFTLSSQQSCLLNLVINGSQVPATGINGGPVICKTKGAGDNNPDPLLCSQPTQANILNISISSAGQHGYVANQMGNSVSYCQVNPATGLLSQCSVAATGLNAIEGVGFNPAGTRFYTANLGSSTISVCDVNQSSGAISNCVDAGGSGFNQPDAVAFNPSGTIFYTSNVTGGVSACLVNANTGQLSSCVNNSSPTFSAGANMTLNSAGTLAYVANRGNSSISVCNVSGQSVTSCNNLSGTLIDAPEGITLDPAGLHAYIANAGDGKVIKCDILQDGTGLLSSCVATGGEFRGTGNVAFNTLGSFAYVPNELVNDVFVCQVSSADGTLSSCVTGRGTTFDGPSGVVIH